MIVYRSPRAHVENEHVWLDRSKFIHTKTDTEHRLEAVTSFARRDLSRPFSVWARVKEAEEPSLFLNRARVDLAGVEGSSGGFVWRRAEGVSLHGAAGPIHRVKITGLRSKAACRAVVFTNDPAFVPPATEVQFEKAIYGARRKDLGASRLSPAETAVRSEGIYTLRYTVGHAGIAVGGGIAVGIPWGIFPIPTWPEVENAPFEAEGSPGRAPFRIASPADGNLRPAREDRRDVWFATREYIVRVEVVERALERGEGIELRFGEEGRKVAIQQSFPYAYCKTEKDCWYTDTVPFRVQVDHSGSGEYVPLIEENSHTFTVHPGRPARFHVTVPSLVGKGRPIRLRLAITDAENSRPAVSVEGLMGGATFKDSTAEAAISLAAGGRLQIKADLGRETLDGQSNPVEVFAKPPRFGLYWGEIHGHTGLGDGIGAPEQYFDHARHVAHLDFTSLTDHACQLTDAGWERILQIANDVHATDTFVTLLGYEWAGRGGHRNIYTSSPELDLLRCREDASCLEELWEAMKGRDDVLAIPHHTLPGGRLDPHCPDLERLIEVYSMWGCSEYRGHPLLDKPERGVSVQEALAEGKRLGIIAGSDNHDGRPGRSGEGAGTKSRYGNLTYKAGLTAVYAEQLSRQAIFAALKARRCYGTTGARITVDFRVNGRWMGEEIAPADPRDISGFVVGADKIDRIEIIRNNETVHADRPEGAAARLQWTDKAPFDSIALRPEGGTPFAFYYLRVVQADGEIAWTSPIWLARD
ncbi:MAG: CehA/McbA family metallohydrolase [Planctomycetes bacterium]|nr:CehA/McbA family metallohydrolase [Planctomycetota bacterium]